MNGLSVHVLHEVQEPPELVHDVRHLVKCLAFMNHAHFGTRDTLGQFRNGCGEVCRAEGVCASFSTTRVHGGTGRDHGRNTSCYERGDKSQGFARTVPVDQVLRDTTGEAVAVTCLKRLIAQLPRRCPGNDSMLKTIRGVL